MSRPCKTVKRRKISSCTPLLVPEKRARIKSPRVTAEVRSLLQRPVAINSPSPFPPLFLPFTSTLHLQFASSSGTPTVVSSKGAEFFRKLLRSLTQTRAVHSAFVKSVQPPSCACSHTQGAPYELLRAAGNPRQAAPAGGTHAWWSRGRGHEFRDAHARTEAVPWTPSSFFLHRPSLIIWNKCILLEPSRLHSLCLFVSSLMVWSNRS